MNGSHKEEPLSLQITCRMQWNGIGTNMLAFTAWLERCKLKVQIAYKHKQTIIEEDSRID